MVTLMLVLAAGPAHAIIVSGGVAGGGGTFQQLTIPFTESTPDNTVGADNVDVQKLFAFNEGQNILVTSPLTSDVGLNPVPAGTIVASHYVFYDPSNGSIEGFVEFDAAVLAVMTSTATLAASDFLLNNGVTYLNPTLRGLEAGDTAVIDPETPTGSSSTSRPAVRATAFACRPRSRRARSRVPEAC